MVRTEPSASSTASETKFSEAISSRLRCWRCASSRRALATSGSTSASRSMTVLESHQLVHAASVAPEGEHIRVVVLPAHPGHVRIETQRSANAADLVRCPHHADAGPADEDAPRSGTGRDGVPDLAGEVGIIDRLEGVRAHVEDPMALTAEPRLQVFLHGIPGVVRAEGDDRHTPLTIPVGGTTCQAPKIVGRGPLR